MTDDKSQDRRAGEQERQVEMADLEADGQARGGAFNGEYYVDRAIHVYDVEHSGYRTHLIDKQDG